MAIDLAGRHFLKELDFTAEEFLGLVDARRRTQGRQEGGHRGPAAARPQHRADLREVLDPHPLLLRGGRRRPGRVDDVHRPGRLAHREEGVRE